MKKQIQFQLWQECNSHCEFCYLGKENNFTSSQIKIHSLEKTLQTLNKQDFLNEYDTISYLGGEFFQGQLSDPKVKKLFFQLMKKTADLYNKNLIKQVWIYATLTIGNQKDLYDTLKLFNDKSHFWVLTSYDTKGRFHSQKMLKNWDFHMKNIKKLYPEIKFNITTILSKDCIEKYLNNSLSFKKMMEEYSCQFFFKQCGSREHTDNFSWFFPPRQLFLKFLKKFKLQESDLMWDKLFNLKYRANELYRNFNTLDKSMIKLTRNKKLMFQEVDNISPKSHIKKCGHVDVYYAYSDDKNGCVLCDKALIEKLIN